MRSAEDMRRAVLDRAPSMDVVVMAAAVADYTASRAPEKLSKDADTFTLLLKKTPDILAELGARRLATGEGPLLVGFAAETQQLVPHAIAKREKKHVDLIVANDVSREDAGFDVDANAVTIIGPGGAPGGAGGNAGNAGNADNAVETLPLQSKARVAAEILDRVEKLLTARSVRR